MEFNENQPEPNVAPDTPNRTKFHPDEAKEPKSEWAKQALWKNRCVRDREQEFKFLAWTNQGRGYRKGWTNDNPMKQMMDRKQRFDAIAGQLELTDYQHGAGRRLRNSQGLRNLGYPDELIAFCLCVFITRYDKCARRTPEKERRIYHPDTAPEENDARFVKLAESLSLRTNLIRQCMGKMASNLPPEYSWYS